jgi:hypothetical protein
MAHRSIAKEERLRVYRMFSCAWSQRATSRALLDCTVTLGRQRRGCLPASSCPCLTGAPLTLPAANPLAVVTLMARSRRRSGTRHVSSPPQAATLDGRGKEAAANETARSARHCDSQRCTVSRRRPELAMRR